MLLTVTSPPDEWGSPVEVERRRRIQVALWARAYEKHNDSLVDDATFDRECLLVNLAMPTGNKKMDAWFKKNFDPSTGMWVHKHPNTARLEEIYQELKRPEEMYLDYSGTGTPETRELARQLRADLDAHTAKKYDDGFRKHLGASVIGDSCSRKLWYGFRWVFAATYIDRDGHDQKGRMLRLFNRGHREEERFVEWLTEMGHEVTDKVDGKQIRIADHNGHYGGSCDGIIKLGGKYADGRPMLLEFKTSSEKAFEKLRGDGVRLAKPEHFAQMCTYGAYLGLDRALYMCVNKNTDEVYIEIVILDPQFAAELRGKALNVITANEPPARICENSAHVICKYCDFAPVCHGQAPYVKNCRSCRFARAAEDKQWRCAKWNDLIPEAYIAQGCDSYEEAR